MGQARRGVGELVEAGFRRDPETGRVAQELAVGTGARAAVLDLREGLAGVWESLAAHAEPVR